MKITYFIYVASHGRGGHVYSLLETATQMAKRNVSVKIISIGLQRSPILDGFAGEYFHVNDKNTLSTLYSLRHFVANEVDTILHAFDSPSFFYTRIFSWWFKLPSLVTKCGGPNPKRYYPYSSQLIVYSEEDRIYFKSKRKFRNVALHIIPNRVDMNPEKQDRVRIQEIKKRLVSNVPVVLRIARIGPEYEKSIKQGIELIHELDSKGISAQLLVIGTVENFETFTRLSKTAGTNVIFITDDRYTINASQLIDVADLVIGTGRGFMEASLLKKIMLSPTENTNLPILATAERLESLSHVNFSERYHSCVTDITILSELVELIDDFPNFQSERIQSSVKSYADANFSSLKIPEKHLSVYSNAIPAALNISDMLLHWVFTSRLLKRIKDKMLSKFS